jgi:uncharacterized membrane protein
MRPAFHRMPLAGRGASSHHACIDMQPGSKIMAFTPVMLVHLTSACGALALGGIVFLMKRGTPPHRYAGRAWVLLMAVTALSSFFIRTHGGFSWIHLLSVLVLYTLTMAVLAIRRRDIVRHQRLMVFAYRGLMIAGLFTLMPGRRLGALAWHAFSLV